MYGLYFIFAVILTDQKLVERDLQGHPQWSANSSANYDLSAEHKHLFVVKSHR